MDKRQNEEFLGGFSVYLLEVIINDAGIGCFSRCLVVDSADKRIPAIHW